VLRYNPVVRAERFGARLCIDAIPLLVRSAGVKNYLYHWIVHLRKLSGPGRVRLFPYLGDPGKLDHERSAASRYGTMARLLLFHAMNRGPSGLADWVLPAVDVFHTAKLLNPPCRARLTATVYDATCHLMPELHTPANVHAEKLFTERILSRADGLIAVSESTRRDAVEVLGLDPRRIQVIYPGIAEEYFQAGPAQIEDARRRCRLNRPYVLFVGTIEPRKNVGTLLDAYQALPAEIRGEFELVVAGPAGWNSDAVLRRLQSSESGVRYLGYVPEPLLPGLFAGAAALAYVSLYEGFGFPVAQAMAAGVPVITSAVSSLPELTGDAAELVDPRSPTEVRAGLCRLLASSSRRSALAGAARQRAERFRWEACARESLLFFETVAGRC
jgi:alpha-1,3-rhamnosyl/mannosyltransferase